MAAGPDDDMQHSFAGTRDRAEFKRPQHRAGIELYRAHIVAYAFEPHAHEGFGFGLIDAGVERFRYRGSDHLAVPESLITMNAGELHTGRAESAGGWRYRMIYVDPAVVEAVTGERGWHFPEAVRHEPSRARRVSSLISRLWLAKEPLAFDSLLSTLLGELRVHAQRAPSTPSEGALRFAPVIEYMRAHLHERVTLEQLAAVAGLSPFHFLRRFSAQHHATPQQMLMALRLLEAKDRLGRGQSPADVAAAVGLSDQAHLTRALQRRYGVTPGRYWAQVAAGR